MKKSIATLLTFAFTALMLFNSIDAQTQSRYRDSMALVNVYELMEGENWSQKNNWLDGPLDTWDRIIIRNDRVVEFSLAGNGVTVQVLSDSIQNMDSLKVLNFNNIGGPLLKALNDGPIPDWFNGINFPQLEFLGLGHNGFTGIIPSSISSISTLKHLNLGDSRDFDLQPVPNWISGSNFPDLEILVLGGNYNGTFPNDFSDLFNLKTFIFGSSSGLTSAQYPSWLSSSNFKSLEILEFGNTNFSGPVQDFLGGLDSLTRLRLIDQNFDPGPIPSTLNENNFPNLTKLNLENIGLNGPLITAGLAKISTLTILTLNDNSFSSGSIPSELNSTNFPNLTTLNISNTNRTGIFESQGIGLSDLGKNNTTFFSLNLSYNNFKDGPLPEWFNGVNFPNLTVLDLDSTNITGLTDAFEGLDKLTTLTLRFNKISQLKNQDLSSARLPVLRSIYLNNNRLQSIPNLPETNPSISTIILADNSLGHRYLDYLIKHPNYGNAGNPIRFQSQRDTVPGTDIYVVQKGDVLDIVVDVPGSPTEYRWYKDGVLLQPDDFISGGKFPVDTVDFSDAGIYYFESILDSLSADPTLDTLFGKRLELIVEGEPIARESNYDSTELVIDFTGTNQSTIDSVVTLLTEAGGELIKSCPCQGPQLWNIPDSLEVDLDRYVNFDAVRRLVIRVLRPDGDDASVSLNYGIEDIRPTNDELPFRWKVSDPVANFSPISTAIVDQGIDANHPDIQPYNDDTYNCNDINFVNGGANLVDSTLAPEDNTGHGTAIAGVVAQITGGLKNSPNDDGNLQILNLKVSDSDDKGKLFDAICALHVAIVEDAKVINLSMSYRGQKSFLLESVIRQAADSNIIIVCAAGNNGDIEDTLDIKGLDISSFVRGDSGVFPASYLNDSFPNLITVGSYEALSKNDTKQRRISQFSNVGDNNVDISAPGANIWTSRAGYPGKQWFSGTSLAVPHVTAVLTQLYSKRINEGISFGYQDVIDDMLLDTNFVKVDSSLLAIGNGRYLKLDGVYLCDVQPIPEDVEETVMTFGNSSVLLYPMENACTRGITNGEFCGYSIQVLQGSAIPTSGGLIEYSFIPGATGKDTVYYTTCYETSCNLSQRLAPNPINCTNGIIYLDLNNTPTTGMNQLDENTRISIHPNPASDLINITNNGLERINAIELLNIQGKRIDWIDQNNLVQQTNQFNLQKLEKGLYFVVVSTEDGKYSNKVMKQ